LPSLSGTASHTTGRRVSGVGRRASGVRNTLPPQRGSLKLIIDKQYIGNIFRPHSTSKFTKQISKIPLLLSIVSTSSRLKQLQRQRNFNLTSRRKFPRLIIGIMAQECKQSGCSSWALSGSLYCSARKFCLMENQTERFANHDH